MMHCECLISMFLVVVVLVVAVVSLSLSLIIITALFACLVMRPVMILEERERER